MKRILLLGAVVLPTVLSCQVPGDRPTMPAMLPDKITPLPYAQLLVRARAQVSRANDVYYVNNWGELEDLAQGLEQTARYLAKADDVPAKHKDTLATTSADMAKLARALREAAAAKDVKKTTAIMTRLNNLVREMRLGD